MKRVEAVVGMLIVMMMIMMVSSVAFGSENCRWQYDTQQERYLCVDSQGQDLTGAMDKQALEEGSLPSEHANCKGKRTLEMSAGGVATFGCDEK